MTPRPHLQAEKKLLDNNSLQEDVLEYYDGLLSVFPNVDEADLLDPESLEREAGAQHIGSKMLDATIDLSFVD